MIKRMIRKMVEKVFGTHPCLMHTGTGLLPRIKSVPDSPVLNTGLSLHVGRRERQYLWFRHNMQNSMVAILKAKEKNKEDGTRRRNLCQKNLLPVK